MQNCWRNTDLPLQSRDKLKEAVGFCRQTGSKETERLLPWCCFVKGRKISGHYYELLLTTWEKKLKKVRIWLRRKRSPIKKMHRWPWEMVQFRWRKWWNWNSKSSRMYRICQICHNSTLFWKKNHRKERIFWGPSKTDCLVGLLNFEKHWALCIEVEEEIKKSTQNNVFLYSSFKVRIDIITQNDV